MLERDICIPSKEEISNSLYDKALLQLRVFSVVLIKLIYLICGFRQILG
jgi:hypothetical protein